MTSAVSRGASDGTTNGDIEVKLMDALNGPESSGRSFTMGQVVVLPIINGRRIEKPEEPIKGTTGATLNGSY